MTINKEEALKRLTTLENETAELRKIISAPIDVFTLTKIEQICAEAGEDMKDYTVDPDASKRQRGKILYATMEMICDVFKGNPQGLSEKEILDYGNSKQSKHYLVGQHSAGSGFSLGDVGSGYGYASVGARLSVHTEAHALHIWKHFSHIWIAYWLGK